MDKAYRLKRFEEKDVSPEETLIDSCSGHSKIEVPVSWTTVQVFYALVFAVLAIFTLTMVKYNIWQGDEFRNLAMGNRSSIYDIPARRGNILDRFGQVVAEDQPVFDLAVVSAALPEDERELAVIIDELSGILEKDRETLNQLFSKRQTQAIFFAERNLNKTQVLKIQNLNYKGLYVIDGAKRFYPQGSQFSAVIGYTGKVGPEDLKSDQYYSLNDRLGRSGIEASYENYLRGEHSRIFYDQARERYLVQSSGAGQSVVLNVEAEVQVQLYNILNQILQTGGSRAGSAVAQNPRTGEILGLVSFPSFDNNLLSGEISQTVFENYFENSRHPLFNRAVGGRYNPGSTIKILLALAGLKEGVITPKTTITDSTGYITIPHVYDPSIVYTYRDWKVQGTVDLKKALAESSDIYFYSVGGGYGSIKGLGFQSLERYFRTFLIDRILGVDLPGENAGFVPNEEWKIETFGQSWFKGDTYNVSIGQGDLLVTPLWLSSYISAVANGGTIYRPWVVKKIVDADGRDREVFAGQELAKLPFDRETLDVVREALREVVVSGTGQMLNSVPVPVAAKTGTTEVARGQSLNSILVAYAPSDDPQISLSIVIENVGKNQGLALAAAKDFLAWYFGPHTQ